ncbi:phytanoyl-CoA dioxygenase family protein [Burkholderia multivorans]|uniref:phytanoyl-CoA dioxygenase family protein n=2 Tax=Burkholderia multivorans TaxID=87883 RepID=UPI000D00E0B0|nr:phytanoyl-CoA dioxygenase family protein [Burkholderia multivorans]MBR8126770.1 phytanoyl-CoA dioxygenase family protein [Burkholderia multivorans]MBR8454245.1 phytanoyl-CoA dioxygenase family protein [Burkholderia multivorans]MBU9449526.1 phytanoyl-CoA dioxygenase family protein [Burkholderia multivorans]MBU9601948.1 phytanoyl-CoA dioxygenase family protein [Burkholderia multivorans]MCL4643441.1 phytanoyl-CoA dioxygenase family protein [Burkholderia multivorans]
MIPARHRLTLSSIPIDTQWRRHVKAGNDAARAEGRPWYTERACTMSAFAAQLARPDHSDPRLATDICERIPVYDCRRLEGAVFDAPRRAELQAEWARVLHDGAGVLVLRHAFGDTRTIDDATAVFESIIDMERARGAGAGDHFAKAGANDRIWNAHEKLCTDAPMVFAAYFSNPVLMAVCEAWLGPCYQMTTQVNVVRPGGDAQQAHRDYHLGFQTVEEAERYPAHVHRMSPFLTLQGAVAHGDMPVESGPTKFLPYSQRYDEGYLAWRREDFRAYFEANFVQLPLAKGDAVFFNPALFHAAGANRTADIQRMANLLQVSSAYGRAMETLDRTRMCETLYPVLRERRANGRMSDAEAAAAVAACAEGYPFPTNLDRDPPVSGLAPESQQALMLRALREDWAPLRFAQALAEQAWRRGAE